MDVYSIIKQKMIINSLSSKIVLISGEWVVDNHVEFIKTIDIKKSIRELKEKFCKNFDISGWICCRGNDKSYCDNCRDIDEVFGRRLI